MFENDDYTDFPEYGRHCYLTIPWRGYRSATIVGRTDLSYRSAAVQKWMFIPMK